MLTLAYIYVCRADIDDVVLVFTLSEEKKRLLRCCKLSENLKTNSMVSLISTSLNVLVVLSF